MRKPLLIYGAGGLGREVLSLVNLLEEWDIAGFVDDGVAPGTLVSGVKVLGGLNVLNDFWQPVYALLALGDPLAKSMIVKKISNPHVQYPVIRHPSSILQQAGSIHLGTGSIITAGVIITTDVSIGEHVLINLSTTVGHDTRIGSYTSIMPGVNLGGEVTIGEAVLIGSGANVRNGVTIGERSKVGMGSVVLSDVAPGTTVAGVPAKPLKS